MSFYVNTGITPITIITSPRMLRTEEDFDLAVNNAQKATGSLPIHTFWLDNYTESDNKRNPEKERKILDILDCAVFLAESAVLRMKRKQKEEEMTHMHEATTVSGQITTDSA